MLPIFVRTRKARAVPDLPPKLRDFILEFMEEEFNLHAVGRSKAQDIEKMVLRSIRKVFNNTRHKRMSMDRSVGEEGSKAARARTQVKREPRGDDYGNKDYYDENDPATEDDVGEEDFENSSDRSSGFV